MFFVRGVGFVDLPVDVVFSATLIYLGRCAVSDSPIPAWNRGYAFGSMCMKRSNKVGHAWMVCSPCYCCFPIIPSYDHPPRPSPCCFAPEHRPTRFGFRHPLEHASPPQLFQGDQGGFISKHDHRLAPILTLGLLRVQRERPRHVMQTIRVPCIQRRAPYSSGWRALC